VPELVVRLARVGLDLFAWVARWEYAGSHIGEPDITHKDAGT
jgi:hypothetical protein